MRPLVVDRTPPAYISSAARAEAERHFCSSSRDAFSVMLAIVCLATVYPCRRKW
jgi:hypothetical protein